MNVHDVFLEIVRASEAFPAQFALEGFRVGAVSALMGPQVAYPRELPSTKRMHTRVRLFTCKADLTDADLSIIPPRNLSTRETRGSSSEYNRSSCTLFNPLLQHLLLHHTYKGSTRTSTGYNLGVAVFQIRSAGKSHWYNETYVPFAFCTQH